MSKRSKESYVSGILRPFRTSLFALRFLYFASGADVRDKMRPPANPKNEELRAKY